MEQLVECVPNFSEGRDEKIIHAITTAIESVDGATLLDVDPGADTNRTVVTFVGTPAGVQEAAFQAIKKAAELIDMRKHSGAHARIGATDVCPFVPVADITMEDCVRIANTVAARVANELGIPVYLYEEAATVPERQNLANIRQGEYEGLAEKLQDPAWAPDFGAATFNARAGATVIGAREFLIAYNVNLNTRDQKLANEIAMNIREAGRLKRDENRNIVRNTDGEGIYIPGIFKNIKAVGWYIEEYHQAQVSINFTNYKIAPPHLVFDEIQRQADKLGLRVTGSELVGLIPLQAVLAAGRHYLKKQGKCIGVSEQELVRMAVVSLGLNDITEFDPDKKIIEYRVRKKYGPLATKAIHDFTDELSSDSPAPGGGSVAALAGSLAAALVAMVANLTVGKKNFFDVTETLEAVAVKAQQLKETLVQAIDEDTRAFNRVMDAFRLPKKTEDQQQIRQAAIQNATIEATRVPFAVLKNSLDVLNLVKTVAEKGNPNAISDAGVAASMARAAAEGAALNVFINLKNIDDQEFVTKLGRESGVTLSSCQLLSTDILTMVNHKITGANS